MSDLPANLSMAGLLAFLHKEYGAEAFAQFLVEVNQLEGRYGDVFSLEKQQDTLKELKTIGLDAVAIAVEDTLSHEWELPHPYSKRIWDDDRERLVKEWQAEMAEKKKKYEVSRLIPRMRPRYLG